jgi:serine/threonine protein phosphatase 1
MATIAIGDIHGNSLALDNVLAKLMPTISRRDVLVFLGDYIDRGPDTRGCLDRIVRLKEEARCAVVTLLGNHEDLMLKVLRDPTCHIWTLALQSFATIRSYSTEAAAVLDREIKRLGPRLITEGLPLPYRAFFDSMPSSHLALLENLELYHRTEDVTCVHGGLLGGVPLHLQDPQTLVLGPVDFPDGYHGQETVVYGHWNNAVEDESGWPWPCVKANRTFGIDTISRGVLTAMRFPDGKIFQSDRCLSADAVIW